METGGCAMTCAVQYLLHPLAPEGNSRTGRNFFHSAKLCFKVSVSSAAGAATFPEAQRIVSRVFGHRASDIPLCISSRLPDMNLALARGSIADQTLPDFRIPPLLDDGSRGTVRQWMDELGLAEFESEGKVAAWVIARQSGSRAIGRQPRQPCMSHVNNIRADTSVASEYRYWTGMSVAIGPTKDNDARPMIHRLIVGPSCQALRCSVWLLSSVQAILEA